jgi:hypothetical protein
MVWDACCLYLLLQERYPLPTLVGHAFGARAIIRNLPPRWPSQRMILDGDADQRCQSKSRTNVSRRSVTEGMVTWPSRTVVKPGLGCPVAPAYTLYPEIKLGGRDDFLMLDRV